MSTGYILYPGNSICSDQNCCGQLATHSPVHELYYGHVRLVSLAWPLQLHHPRVAPWPCSVGAVAERIQEHVKRYIVAADFKFKYCHSRGLSETYSSPSSMKGSKHPTK